jgi:hypothetical protein
LIRPGQQALLPLAVLTLYAVTTACSSEATASRTQLEQRLVTVQRQKVPELVVGTAHCSGNLAATSGSKVTCTVLVDGVSVPWTFTATGRHGGKLSYTVRNTQPVIDFAKAEIVVKSRLTTAAEAATVHCGAPGGHPVLVAPVGATFPCTLALGASSRTVTLRIDDLDGNAHVVSG